jgi:hypothetical protein
MKSNRTGSECVASTDGSYAAEACVDASKSLVYEKYCVASNPSNMSADVR